ncbi:dihydropteroate synthase [Pedobacter sp. GR22-6]|uniref:dihydropteroate synthase n=1 Tax=Pedobacter sp. GR22-6 TaxID=3127957 RepID=UPI00307E6756
MAKDTFLNGKTTVNLKGKLLDLAVPAVMAILNITPDSFYAGSRSNTVDDALRRAEGFLNDGAKFIDIGAYSSRPGAAELSPDEELQRLLLVIEAITKKLPEAILSIDTFRARVAKEAILAGAHMINDISAGSMDEAMFETVAELQVPYVIMHMKGTPQTMQQHTQYQDIGMEVVSYFAAKVTALKKLGVKDIIIDPGFGFAKTLEQNYELFRQMDNLQVIGLPMLVGISRKSMIYKLLDTTPEAALNGTTVLNTLALQKGAAILRVHDVREAVECIKILTLA